jgi:hypothetical protein
VCQPPVPTSRALRGRILLNDTSNRPAEGAARQPDLPSPPGRGTKRRSAEPFDTCRVGRVRAHGGFHAGSYDDRQPSTSSSLSSPRANVSLMPAAHLLIVLKVSGAASTASASGNGSCS